MALPDSFIQELKLKTDIDDIVSSYVTLRRRGRISVGLCPFHNEKTPSFTVYPDTQSFYCFGCGAGGDAIGFIKRIENLDYIDAVKSLAERAGMQMPDEGFDDSLGKKRRLILEINRAAAKFFHSYMMSQQGRKGLNYFTGRGLTHKTINRFGLGYAPEGWDVLTRHLNSLGYKDPDIVEAGLAIRSRKNQNKVFDFFRDRAMTPVIDIRGNVIAFSGRDIDGNDNRKYINTPDTLAYKKTNELFALNIAKDSGSDALILCEGQMDVIAMHQAGFSNAVAGFGTALTSEQVRLISRYANEVILCYDNDEAGKKAVNKAIGMFKNTDLKIRIPALSGGKDPDEIIKNVGKERFAAMLDGSANEIEFEILNARNKYNLDLTQERLDFLNDIIKILSGASKIEQELYVSKICDELNIEKESVMAQLRRTERNNQYKNRRKVFENERQSYQRETARESFEKSATTRKIKAENRMLSILLRYPKCSKLCKDFDENNLTEGFMRKAYRLTLDFIDNGMDTDISLYSQYLSDSEISTLTKLVNMFSDSKDYEREFKDCLNTVIEENSKKTSVDAGELSDDDFLKLMQSISNKKTHKSDEEK